MDNSSIDKLKVIQEIWLKLCNAHIEEYLKNYVTSDDSFTQFITTLVTLLARELNFQVIAEYYSLDFAMYKEEDLVPNKSNTWNRLSGTWLKQIRIAFEHENRLDSASGGYQEFSHLLLTTADAKVLVGVGSRYDTYDPYAYDYQSLMKNLDYYPLPILFIGEYSPFSNHSQIHVESYIIAKDVIIKYQDSKNGWIVLE